MNARRFLSAGDVIRIEIAEIGAIEHEIVAGPDQMRIE